MLLFQVFIVSMLWCFSFSFFLGMSKAQTPSPHASKKHDKRCDSCQSYVSELDPHPVCLKCVPRECNKELPCSHCAPPLPGCLEAMGTPAGFSKVLFDHEGVQRGFGQGGGGGVNLGRQRPLRGIAQLLLLPPRLSLLVSQDWQHWNLAFRPSGRKSPPCSPVYRDASRRPIPQVSPPRRPVIVTGVLAV